MLRIAVAPIAVSPIDDADPQPRWMGDSERRRWAGLPAAARRRFAASRVLLRQLLHEGGGIAVDACNVSAEAGSAPVVTARGLAGGTIRASLSHRLGWVAAAIADKPVGVDIECERLTRSDPRERAALMLSPAELARWQALPADELEGALLTAWTLKEAWFKACPPEAVPWDFRLVAARACAPERANVRAWTASSLHVALCCEDAAALATVSCVGLDGATARTSFWRVERAAPKT